VQSSPPVRSPFEELLKRVPAEALDQLGALTLEEALRQTAGQEGQVRAWLDEEARAWKPPPPAAAPFPEPRRRPLTPKQLKRIMPSLTTERAKLLLPALLRAMREAQVTTPRRQAAFLAQLAHESGQFRWFEELRDGALYEGRADLGNVRLGDGIRFKGRGPIQLTGRANYRAAGRALKLPLEKKPSLAASVEVGFRVAAWFWRTRGLNTLADQGRFDDITTAINGGQRGAADRRTQYRRALKTLQP
jgi:putative chitinase